MDDVSEGPQRARRRADTLAALETGRLRGRRRRGRRPSRLATRIVITMMVPVLGLGAVCAQSVSDHAARVTVIKDAEHRASQFATVVAFDVALGRERWLLSLSAVDEATASPRASTSASLPAPPPVRRLTSTDEVRAAVNRAAGEFVEIPWVDVVMSRVRTVRARTDTGRVTAKDLVDLGSALEVVHERVLDLGAALSRSMVENDAPGGLRADLLTLMLLEQAVIAYDRGVGAALSAVVTPETSAASWRVVQGALTTYDLLRAQVTRLASGDDAEPWQTAQTSFSTSTYETAVRAAAAGAPGEVTAVTIASVSPDVLMAGMRAAQERAVALKTMTGVFGKALAAERRRAQSALARLLMEIVAALLIALLGVVLVVRGVTRPLRRLQTRADLIAAGDLAAVPLSRRGPREIGELARAVDHIAETLVLVERQVDGLADGIPDDVPSRQVVPGRLGRSLDSSMVRLTQSISARQELEIRLRHESTHDRLTGLLNRSALLVALEAEVGRLGHGGTLAVLVIDLDGLTRINESEGHEAGDAVLRAASDRLRRVSRMGDVVARLGADEFAVIAEVDDPSAALELAQRVQQVVQATPVPPRFMPTVARQVSASVGLVLVHDPDSDGVSLLRDADMAVRRAKVAGGGRVEVFDETLRAELDRRTTIEKALSVALRGEGLRLNYQPIVDGTARIRGFEALCRWTDPVLGVIGPDVFIGVAEDSDLIIDLDRWVLMEAARQLARWSADPALDHVYLSVNVSGRHLMRDELVGDLEEVLRTTGVDPRRLVLEVTETVLMNDFTSAAEQLSRVRDLGIRIAVDDFGTGYTSIAHLQLLPVDIVKIDRSFVAGVTGSRGHSLVDLMINMADVLGLGLIAEGVERIDEFERLSEMGCALFQGYLFGRPAAPDEIVWDPPQPLAGATEPAQTTPIGPGVPAQATAADVPPVSDSSSSNVVGKTVRG